MMIIKQGRLKCITCTNKGDELYDVPIYYTKFLKYDYSSHRIEGIHHIQLNNHPVRVKVQNAHNTMDYNFTFALGCKSKLAQGKMC
jgi:hypothetical protein